MSYGGVAVVGAVLMTGAWFAASQAVAAADVPLHGTPAWAGGMPQYGEHLQIRRDTPYRYDRRTRAFALLPPQEWERAGGPIADCGKQMPPPPKVMTIDSQSRALMAGPRQIPTAGRTVLTLTVSPGDRFVAVLSAAGPSSSLLPSLGTGSGSGQRYHQTVSLPDVAVKGNTTRVPVRRNEDVLGTCWSSEADVIVYHDVLFTYLSIVEVEF